MNEQTKYIMGVYQVALVIDHAMEFAFSAPNRELTPEQKEAQVAQYEQIKQLAAHVMEDAAPLPRFCKANSDKEGDTILKNVNDFFYAVYGIGEEGEAGPIVTVVNNAEGKKEIRVETSLVTRLLDYSVGLHETVSEIIQGFINKFEPEGLVTDGFQEVIALEDRKYRSAALYIISSNICNSFLEYNKAVRAVINEKKAQGIDVTSSEFHPEKDPSVYFINQELSRLISFSKFVVAHNKTLDESFVALIDAMNDKLHYFTGTKKLAEGQTIGDAMNEFQDVFKQEVVASANAWQQKMIPLSQIILDYENGIREQMKQESLKAAAAKEEEKVTE